MADGITAKRTARLGIGFALATSGVLLAMAPAEAAKVELPQTECSAGAFGSQAVDITFEAEIPATVDAGSTFEIILPERDVTLPLHPAPPFDAINILNYKNLSSTFKVVGATLVGTATADGQPTINGTPFAPELPEFTADTLKIKTSGPVVPGTLHTPKIHVPAVAGAAGTTVTIQGTGLTTTANVGLDVPVSCDTSSSPIITSAAVVTPPPPPAPPAPPGAPNTVNDERATPKDTPITIDVLANDTPADADTPLDPATLGIKANPEHGAAAVVDGKILYTPNTGFTGRDTFQYEICSTDKPAPTTTTTIEEQEVPAKIPSAEDDPVILEGACHFAFVTVDVEAPPVAPVTVAPTTVAPATTVAVAAAAELPRTGRTSGPLAIIGLSFVVGGAMLARSVRSRSEREQLAG